SPTTTRSMRASCVPPPVSRCCGARRWDRCRSATRSRFAPRAPTSRTASRATRPSGCSSPSADRSDGGRMSAPSYSAAQLADRFGLAVAGDPATLVRGVATLAGATPDTLGFLANPRYRAQLSASRAGIVVMRAEDAEGYAGTALLARDPYSTFARIAALFEPVAAFEAGVHPSAVVDATARIDPGAHIGPHVVVGARSVIDAGASLGPGCIVGEDCHVGAGAQ